MTTNQWTHWKTSQPANSLTRPLVNRLTSQPDNRLTKAGQATMEYFILFTVLAVLTIIGGSTFFSQVSNTMDNFTVSAVNTMEQPNLDSF